MKQRSTKHMNSIFLSAAAMGLALTALLAQAEAKAHEHKKDILHLFIQKKMANEGVIADAKGDVDIHENLQSKGKQQEIHIKVKDLEANAGYQVFALVDADTNSTQVAEFTTDRKRK